MIHAYTVDFATPTSRPACAHDMLASTSSNARNLCASVLALGPP